MKIVPLEARAWEIAGLAGSLLLRCDDCTCYRVIRAKELGLTREQMLEISNPGRIDRDLV